MNRLDSKNILSISSKPLSNKKNRENSFIYKNIIKYLIKDRWLYFMLLPGVLYFIIFKYGPMWGLLIAFKDYQPFMGFMGSKWVGFKHFIRLFTEATFWLLFRNTLLLAVYNLLFFFPLPIIFALMLNELRNTTLKRIIQTITYIPHFMSWVIVVGISYILFTTEGGIINEVLYALFGFKIDFLSSVKWFRPMIVGQTIWKETGWGTIIFIAALTNIDPQLYESAYIDGANRWEQLWHITLPSIRSTIIVLLLLRLGNFLDTGFEHIFLMLNATNREVGEVFDTYVYNVGIKQGQYSYTTAVGFFKSFVSLILVYISNSIAKKFGEEGIY
ncbi:putative aldouronate transport system permease protein [Caldicoprobacter guelmensis]|uniref:ABC transporter permease n=1 Tax=Caldicoprobacter guelmensis TaxID=1170224 RepID=UPI00195BF01D|nr:sugar ABC transporter permease [Caldicoprobacter guelmensis]MBM7583412.1 putative aldouronate transport system permease protein [Caldicoprobacter guelmensis]